MKALVTTGQGGVELQEVPEAVPGESDLLVRATATSLNRGELRGVGGQAGFVPGWDVAGVVERAAADGSGPGVGARVTGLRTGGGGWAELVAIPTAGAAELPDGVSDEVGSTLPIAGLTALHGIALGGDLLRRRVLITGAAGGVGRFAVQLAARAGARVTAVARDPSRAEGLQAIGAHETVTSVEDAEGRFDLTLDGAGGATLGAVLERVAPGGRVFSFGNSSGEPTTFEPRSLYAYAHGASLHSYLIFTELQQRSLSADLARLVALVADGAITPQIALTAGWTEANAALEALQQRTVNGKAVLRIGG